MAQRCSTHVTYAVAYVTNRYTQYSTNVAVVFTYKQDNLLRTVNSSTSKIHYSKLSERHTQVILSRDLSCIYTLNRMQRLT